MSRSENSSVLVGAPNEPEIRSEPRVSNGRYGAQLTLKYHRCGSVRDGIRHGARLRWGFQGERGIWARDKGPKDRPILWTPKLADPRSPIRANYPSRSYSLRGNVHPGNVLLPLSLSLSSIGLFDFLRFRRDHRNSARINFQRGVAQLWTITRTKIVNRGGAGVYPRNRDPGRRRRIVNPGGCLIEGKVARARLARACSTDGRGLIRHRDSA